MLELILRIGLSLLVVFGLMWGLARLVKRPLTGRGGGTLAVLARQQLGRSASVAVVRVVDRALVLGVTDGQVTLLAETDLAALEQQAAGPATTTRRPVPLNGATGLDGANGLGANGLNGTDTLDGANGLNGANGLGGTTLVGPVTAGRLHGSILSPATWRQTVDFMRERTARR